MTEYGRPVRAVVVLAVAVIALVYIVNNRSGDDEDTTTEATLAPDTGGGLPGPGHAGDEPAVDHKRCGTHDRWRLVVYGDIRCSLARHVMRGFAPTRLPPFWTCEGPDGHVECAREGGVITAR